MSTRLGGFIAGQNINIAIGTFTAITSPTFTFASTSATPAVGQAVQFTTTGTLPTGLSINTTYYVISVSTNTCQFSTTLGGSAVTFTNSSGSGTHTAVVPRPFNPYSGVTDTVEYLLIAGGGAGAGGVGGGGGAGGLLQGVNLAVTPASAYTITIGAGGTAGAAEFTQGSSGSNSVFGSFTAIGGGLGGSAAAGGGATGGSGGGATAGSNGFAGTSGQGNAGGAGNSSGAGGGGGGSGSVGQSATAIMLGAGGAGTVSTITGTPVQYAGGGGGGNYWNGSSSGLQVYPGAYGSAGGGDGATSYNPASTGSNSPQNGTPARSNSGSGGGGATGNGGSNMATGGNGGSGFFVLRYPQINAAPAMVTGSPQVRYADGYQIYIWTSSGSIIF